MNKTIFFSGLSFFILETLIFLGFMTTQINVSKQMIGIVIFGTINILFAIVTLIGALKDDD